MKIKVCGINNHENFMAIGSLDIDVIGLNFYPQSKRYVSSLVINLNMNSPVRAGVFVDNSIDEIRNAYTDYGLSYAQLHGDQDARFCQKVQEFVPVIKVFRIDSTFDFTSTDEYSFCNLFLFDTKTNAFGGSGIRFPWNRLDEYKGNTSFWLSGGIAPSDANSILNLYHPKLAGVDINSQFELEPGIKDINKVREFVHELKNEKR